jgi:hypothetical protein
MTIQGLDYFYASQIPRFLEQIVRAFSGFQYETGWRNGEPPQLKMVPCRMASRDRMIGHIMRNNSENTLLAVPMITVDQTGFTFNRARLQNPAHVDTRQVTERGVDDDGNYTGDRGNSYTIRRMMPLPFDMTVQIDVWTSNQLQKYMLMEQILMVIAPDIDIQNSDNALDWTAKTMLELEDINWTSRTIPIGTESEIEVSTITMKQIVWLSPPSEVTNQRLIEQIVTNLHARRIDTIITDVETEDERLARIVVTPGNHVISVSQGIITLLGPEGAHLDPNGEPYNWASLLSRYGVLEPTISTLRLKLGDIEDQNDVVGTIQLDNNNVNKLFWQIDPDTLPANDTPPIDGVIDPLRTWPGNGLPAIANGQRYLLQNDVANSTVAWGNLSAKANDIIQYSTANNTWAVSFNSSAVTAVRHVVNMTSGNQLRWTDGEWVLSIDGEYGAGYWRLRL